MGVAASNFYSIYSLIFSIAQTVIFIALLVALFLLVLQLIKYFKSRNLALAHENTQAEAVQQPAAPSSVPSDADSKADEASRE